MMLPSCCLYVTSSVRLISNTYRQIRPRCRIVLQINNVSKRFVSSSRRSASVLDHDPETLYCHSSGRWLWNEELQMARRRREFKVMELVKATVSATGSLDYVRMIKLPEGNYNKAFLLTMDNGKEVLAKIPNPNAGYEHLVTASEVATMDYVRNVLGLPVPRVFAWSSTANNPVGAEYILMEKCPGVELNKVWDVITPRQKASIIQQLVSYETAFDSSNFPMYGSLYYAEDLGCVEECQRFSPSSNRSTYLATFAVGQSTDKHFFDYGEAAPSIKHGPWETVEEYDLAVVEHEIARCQRSRQFPNPQGFYNGPGQYQQSRDKKLQVLRDYEKVMHYLKPKMTILSKPILWHTDLHSHNIFVDENDPTQITAIIDWQAVHIAPLFAQAQHPSLLDFEGETPDIYDTDEIKLPENFSELSEEERKAAKKLRTEQLLWKIYEAELMVQCPVIHRAIGFGQGLFGKLSSLSQNVSSDGELYVEHLLMILHQEWSQVVDDPVAEPCPISYTDEEKSKHIEELAQWSHSIELMVDFLTRVGGYRCWDGSVSHEIYRAAKEQLGCLKEDFSSMHSSTEADKIEWLKAWSFPD